VPFQKKEGDAKENENLSNASNSSSSGIKGKHNGKKKESNKKKIKNGNQDAEFKITDGKTWEKTFQGTCPESRVKSLGTFMCPHFYLKGECWSDRCRYKKLHVPAAKIPDKKKQVYLEYMAECRRKSSIK
jgi:hypothetical protein